MWNEVEEVDEEEIEPVAEVVSLEQVKYDEFWSDPCWTEPVQG